MIVPVKAFDAAKSRLAASLDAGARAALAQTMATRVVHAGGPLPVFVATDDDAVGAWAHGEGASVVWTAGLDLNGSVALAIEHVRESGAPRVVIAHGDLPYATDLTWTADFPGATLIPDRREDGTNVLCVSTALPFVPMYGPGSFQRHLEQLGRRGVAIRISRRAELLWDVDVPDDVPAGLQPHADVGA